MSAALAQIASIAILVFAVSSMMSVGLAYRLRTILGPLREFRAVFRALVANFALVPLLAVGIERVIPLDPPLALGLFLLAGSAGAPFLIKLASAARRNRLRLEAIAAAIGDQDRRIGRVLLDLLAQAVDVGFERMGGDAGVVAPDLVQQDIARHRPVAGAEQVLSLIHISEPTRPY